MIKQKHSPGGVNRKFIKNINRKISAPEPLFNIRDRLFIEHCKGLLFIRVHIMKFEQFVITAQK